MVSEIAVCPVRFLEQSGCASWATPFHPAPRSTLRAMEGGRPTCFARWPQNSGPWRNMRANALIPTIMLSKASFLRYLARERRVDS